MRRHWFLRGLKFLLFAILFVAIAGLVVMRLWNWLTPALFGWHVITFWQAIGILILSKLLLGGFRGRPGWHPVLAPPHDGALGTHDARGAPEIQGRNARPLRTFWPLFRRNESLARSPDNAGNITQIDT